MEKKYNFIDLFAGCGGLLDGFMQSGLCNPVASVEWEKAPVDTLVNRLKKKWEIDHAEESTILFDVQRVDELFDGFDDIKYGKHIGLTKLIGEKTVDFIIGGPPCQAYSVAGRIRDNNYMRDDYRNYLFEYYLQIVSRIKPKLFVFENVPGMLSAMPDGTPIIDLIRRDISKTGYEIIEDIRKFAVLDASDFGVPQQRHRVILIGLSKEYFKGQDIQKLLRSFYDNLTHKYKKDKKVSVEEAIGDLPPCYPLWSEKRPSHTVPKTSISWHYSRFHSPRDAKIFQMLAADVDSGENKYHDSTKLCDLYNKVTGKDTKVHKYHVLKRDEPSTTILAHLYKDGLRFIHYDPLQARSITVREAARLQSFDDDFDFVGSQTDAYKMIGNAVPPKLAKTIALAINDFLSDFERRN